MDFLEKIDKSFYNFSEFYHLDSVPKEKNFIYSIFSLDSLYLQFLQKINV